MADWHSFGYKGEPNTCKWCGRPLHFKRAAAKESQRDDPTFKEDGFHFYTVQAKLRGGYQDGHFCGLRCAYQFAVDMADKGHVLRNRGAA